MITMHPKIKHKSQGNILWNTKIPSEHLAMVALEQDYYCTLVRSSSKGSYTSQQCETHRITPIMLMEIMIQQQHTQNKIHV